jgi:phage head maturation protease
MLWAHDPAEPIGVWETLEDGPRGLRVRGRLNLEVQRAREAHALLKQGAVNGLSIGFLTQEAERRQDGGRRITRAELWEVSLVTFPARREARVAEVKSVRDLERLLRDAGLPRAAATKAASGGWPALAGEPDQLGELARLMRRTADTLKGTQR